jgi:crossover junction endodeoxyribonuclease RuvC
LNSLIIGIDPGQRGGLAVLDSAGGFELAIDLPIITDKSLTWIDGGELQSIVLNATQGRQSRAVVERVSSMPRQGVASSFAFGVGLGSILGVLQAMRLPIELVTPATWKRALGLTSDKRASLDKARLLFPSADLRLAKHDGRAEALLLCHWYLNRPKQVAA